MSVEIDPGSTVISTPEWIKLASEEIAKEFNLDFWGRIHVGAIICKQFRLHEKSRSNTSEVPTNP
jgi:hypothetical protein